VLVSRDVSDRKQTEMHLMISDRMASVGTLAAGVAHEINNPLAAVITNLDLMHRDLSAVCGEHGLSDRLRDVFAELRDARESADRMRHIVRDLKIFSRSTDDEQTGAIDVHRV